MGKIKVRKIIIGLVLIISTIIVSIFASILNKPFKGHDLVKITVREGESFYSVLEELKLDNKIKSEAAIKIYLKFKGEKVEVLPGYYEINSEASISEIIAALESESNAGKVSITVPEGYSIDDMADLFEEKGLFSKESFIKAVEEYPLPNYVRKDTNKRYNLEGFLFPNTYQFNKNSEPSDVIKVMLDQFESEFKLVTEKSNVFVDESRVEDIVTVASIIEKEAQVDEERSIVSSVIYNRLKIDMKLQIDATVIYALGHHVNEVLHSDLEVDSPYNTYKNYGLPVGPISNPGFESMEAALNPDNTNYIYYVLKDDKTHYFTHDAEDFYRKQDELGY